MSKVDAQRAMREAKYARDSARGLTRREEAAAAATSAGPAPQPSSVKPAPAPAAKAAAVVPEGDRCGHKSMNGRGCTREAGHAEKSHRYG